MSIVCIYLTRGGMILRKYFKKSFPIILDINPTDDCNLYCLSCWKRNPKFKDLNSRHYELPDSKLLGIIDEASELNIKEIEITGGGEPLLRKITPVLMKKVKEKKIKGSITTNGILFNDRMINDLVDMGWDRIIFSLDGPNKEINDYLRGKSFDKIMEVIKSINRCKSRYKKKNPLLYFNVVISNKNYNLLEEFIKLAWKLKIDYIKFETLTIHSDLGKKLQLSEGQKNEFLANTGKALLLASKLKVKTNLDVFNEDMMKEPAQMGKFVKANMCFEPFYHMVVKTDGSVGPCCLFYGKSPNVKNHSLSKIWNGRYFNNLRENVIKGNLMDYCKICNVGQITNNIRLMNGLKCRSK